MTLDQIFSLASIAAMLGWLLLITAVLIGPSASSAPSAPSAPRRALLFVGGRCVPLLLCAVYITLLVLHWKSAPGGNFGSLDGVVQLFSSRGKLLGGWVHFLAFDLFIGRWVIDDVLLASRSRWLLLPSLPLIFMFGPAGLLLYFALRTVAPGTSAVLR